MIDFLHDFEVFVGQLRNACVRVRSFDCFEYTIAVGGAWESLALFESFDESSRYHNYREQETALRQTSLRYSKGEWSRAMIHNVLIDYTDGRWSMCITTYSAEQKVAYSTSKR